MTTSGLTGGEQTSLERIKVLIADTQRLFSEALATALRLAPHLDVIDEYPTTGSGAVAAHARERPDVVLLDYWMGGLDGPTATHAMQANHPATKVLLLSWIHGPHHVQRALESGAAVFLPKSLTVPQVMEAIRWAHEGQPLVFANPLARPVDTIESRQRDPDVQVERLGSLTPRELEVLQLLSEGLGAPDISRELKISSGTTKNHIHRILAKLKARSQLEAVALARLAGLVGGTRFPGKTQ